MADERRIFPTETVLELLTGKKGGAELASYLVGRVLPDDAGMKAAAPFAAAWLARWYPRFMDMEIRDDADFNNLLAQAKARVGANISLSPISGKLKTLADQTLATLKDANESLLRQTDAAVALERRVRELEPLEKTMEALQKKNAELEDKLKAMKTEMGVLQRQVNAFQGKVPVDNEELLQTIKDAIRDGLKGATIGGAAATAIAEAEAPEAVEEEAADEFGFGKSKSADDEFGF